MMVEYRMLHFHYYLLVFEESVERYVAKTHVSEDCKHFGG